METKQKYSHNTIGFDEIYLYVAPSCISSFVRRSGSLYVISEDMLPFLMELLEMQPEPISVVETLTRQLRRQAEKILAEDLHALLPQRNAAVAQDNPHCQGLRNES